MSNKKNMFNVERMLAIITVFVVLILWIMATKLGWVSQTLMPSPKKVLDTFVNIVKEGYKGTSLLGHIAISMKRLFLAMLYAIIVAIPLGFASGYSKKIRAIFETILSFYRPLPPLAYYSLLVLWVGIGDTSKILLLFLAGFSPIYISCMSAIQRVKEDYINAAETLGASKLQTFIHVILPSSFPDIFIGVRNALSGTYRTLVAAEMVAAVSGLGWMVMDAGNYLRSDVIFVGIIIMGITGLLLEKGILLLEKWLVPWAGKE